MLGVAPRWHNNPSKQILLVAQCYRNREKLWDCTAKVKPLQAARNRGAFENNNACPTTQNAGLQSNDNLESKNPLISVRNFLNRTKKKALKLGRTFEISCSSSSLKIMPKKIDRVFASCSCCLIFLIFRREIVYLY